MSHWRLDGLATWRAALAAPEITAATAGRLTAALRDTAVRDAVIVSLVPNQGTVAEDSLTMGATPNGAISKALDTIMSPTNGVMMDPETADAAKSVLTAVTAHTGEAASTTLLGFLAWWQNDGPRAGVLIDRALTTDPDYRFAHLLNDSLASGMAPGWIRRGIPDLGMSL
jgi:hypothetical protein